MDSKDNKIQGDDSGEIIDVLFYSQSGNTPPQSKKYRIKVDDLMIVIDHQIVTGKEILEKAGKTPAECHTLYQKFKGCDFEKISLNEKVDLATPGIEEFTVKPPEVFYYSVDGEPETTDEKYLTPVQILELAGVIPAVDYYLVQINLDDSQTSYKDSPDTPIQMRCPKMRFISAFRGETPVS